ncbi:MAG: DUF4935 domain-containing protein [Alphaproteobacteria bacterium]|nr:DUF4935 domain-containing protein [Alphaproteobacteria bacterium]
MFLFIDANVYLSFYHMTSDDLEELEKLVVLIKNKEIILYAPEQTINEVRRNRASKIKDGLAEFKKHKLNIIYPAYCKDYPEYNEMKNAQSKLEKEHSEIVKKIENDINKENLKADLLLKSLFDIAHVITTTDEILSKARNRVDVGNPPGKKGSLGDAIIWESLLTKDLPSICMITEDSDFLSPLNPDGFNEFLLEEWAKNYKIGKKPAGRLTLFRKLSLYFNTNYPEITLETETEKDLLIADLAVSLSFAQTHLLIEKLGKYKGFTQKQKEDLAEILLNNNQVGWIVGDPDVNNFYKKIYESDEFLFELVIQEGAKIKKMIYGEEDKKNEQVAV